MLEKLLRRTQTCAESVDREGEEGKEEQTGRRGRSMKESGQQVLQVLKRR